MSKYFIGVMTGTSADSLDGCIVSFEKDFNLIETEQIELGNEYKDKYEKCIRLGFKEVNDSDDLLEIENTLNEKTIEIVESLIAKSKLSKQDISLIGLSGQTIFHTYDKSYQLGNNQKIANTIGINICSDFRNFDIKQGGMGAPLIPIFHKYLYSENNKNKLVINIGGISNGTYLEGINIKYASDVGPGNCLIDKFTKQYFDKSFDNNGEISSTGRVNEQLINRLIKETSDMVYPRADDKNAYYKLIDNKFFNIPPEDILRTLVDFTATKINDFFSYCDKPQEVIFHGGGTKNIFLMDSIKDKLGCEIRTTDKEIPSKFVEAAAFAYLAYRKKGEIYLSK